MYRQLAFFSRVAKYDLICGDKTLCFGLEPISLGGGKITQYIFNCTLSWADGNGMDGSVGQQKDY
jgi:hypothetical protein